MSLNGSHGGSRHAGRHRASVAGGTLLLAAGAMLLAACGGGTSSHSSTATQPPGTQASAASPTTMTSAGAASTPSSPTVLSVRNARFGPILTNAKGMTLYVATGDTATTTGCTGGCLNFWPPLILPAGQTQPVAGPGLTGLGTFMRSDGIQVTYHGKPLYTWIKDTAPGQITGEGVVDSGGTWHVATVAGTAPSAATGAGQNAPTTVPASPPTTAAPSSGGASF